MPTSSRPRTWFAPALAVLLVLATATTAAALHAPTARAHYGAHAHFARLTGAGHHVHRSANGERDVNACVATAPGIAHCDARVVLSPAATTNSSASPVATTPSSCSTTTDLNAPSVVVAGGNGGYDPCYLESAYNVAAAAQARGGVGQIVAIVDYSVDPTIANDLATYRAQFGLPACPTGTVSSSNTGCVFQQVAQSGAPTSGSSGWDVEISLDVDAVSAMCPQCQILLMEASSASTTALGSAVNTAVADGAIAVSNSYGSSEFSGEASSATSYYQHPGVAIVASSGDTAGLVEFPAVAPDVVGVGGTSLLQYGTTGTRSANATESVWNGTPSAGDGAGAGCSAYVAAPTWQSSFISAAGGTSACSKRVTADVSADADPDTGLWIYDSYTQGGWLVVGGTSLASPIIASMYALAGNAAGSSVYPGSTLYADSSLLSHVTVGNVGSCGTYLCDATKSINGYNGPTGLGTPGGAGALAAFTFNAATPPVTPASPGTPTASGITPTSATLSWSAVSGATSYALYEGATPTSLALVNSAITGTSTTVTGLTPSTGYYFALSATNSAGASAVGSSTLVTTTALSAPSAPTALSGTSGNTSVSLKWTAPASTGGSPITGYTVYYATTSGGELQGSSLASATTSTTVSGLTNGTPYYFEVVATNTIGSSAVSNEVAVTPAAALTAPTAPTLTSATAGNGSVVLAWTAPSSNGGSAITGYTIYDGTTATPKTKIGTVSATSTSATVTGLTAGTKYYFSVVATNGVGSSPASNVLSATPLVSPPSAPTNLSVRARGSSVSLSWRNAQGTGPISYTVLVSTSSSMTGATSYSAGSSTSYSVSGLSSTTTYYFEVVATNAGGSSTPAGPVSSLG